MEEAQQALWKRLVPHHPKTLARLEASVHAGYRFPWRIAEAPALVSRADLARDMEAMERLMRHYASAQFRSRYQAAAPLRFLRPDDSGWFPRFVATDYTRTVDGSGVLHLAMPEAQSFPGNLLLKPAMLRALGPLLPEYGPSDLQLNPSFRSDEEYVARLRRIVCGDLRPEETIVLEVAPLEQKTVVDMLLFVKTLGVRLVDLADLEADPRTGDLHYRKAVVFKDGMPRVAEFSRPETARRVLSRCLPEELDSLIQQGTLGLTSSKVSAIFQDSIMKRAALFVVHPQDFFVICKSTLVGNPWHHPPLEPVDDQLLPRLASRGLKLEDGIIKAASRAGGQGLLGYSLKLGEAELQGLIRTRGSGADSEASLAGGEPTHLWQQRYQPQSFDRAKVFAGRSLTREEVDPVYCELRLMWAVTPKGESDLEFDLLTGMTRWSRLATPANAGHQKTPLTGTHGILRGLE